MVNIGKISFFSAFVLLVSLVLFLAYIFLPLGLKSAEIKVGDSHFTVEIADTVMSRIKGLSGRQSLVQGKGMLFVFSDSHIRQFWMKDMHFPIDIIWISGNTVVGVTENIPVPEKKVPDTFFSSPAPVDKVLEINAGEARSNKIKAETLVLL